MARSFMGCFRYFTTVIDWLQLSHDNDIDDVRMEIELDSAYLTCVFNKDKICEDVAISLKEQPNIIDYIYYCKKRYRYNYLLQNWLIDDSTTIQIDNDNNEFSLYVLS